MAQSGSGNPVIVAALARMAALRQAPGVDVETLDLFSAELTADGHALEDIVTACDRLAKTARGEGETAFPDYGSIVAACRAAFHAREAERRRVMALEGAKIAQHNQSRCRDMSPEESRAFMAQFKAAVEARRLGPRRVPQDAA